MINRLWGWTFCLALSILTAPVLAAADDSEIARLIKQLGNDEFAQRETASRALIELGDLALPALRRAAAASDDLEIRGRSDGIIQAIAFELGGNKPKVVVRASGIYQDRVPEMAFDNDPRTIWNSGGPAPHWFEADMGALRRVLIVALLPDHSDRQTGETIHEIWVSRQPIGDDRTGAVLLHTFKQQAVDSRELKFRLPMETLARYIQIRTTQSPSWVAWREIDLRVR